MDLTDEAKAEIQAAVKILRDDGVHIHKSYAAFQKSQEENKDKPEDKPDKSQDKPEDKPTEGEPPPPKPEPTEKPKKKGLWWGDAE